jgi:hypothetical protein
MSLMMMCPVPRRAVSDAIFSVLSLFASGEQGVLLEPWDTTTMFQDAAGTIPVTDYGQAVGLRLDKRKGLVLGPELITNGGFDTDTDWTKNAGVTVSGGELVFTSVASANGASQDSSGIVAGRLYKVKLNVTSITAGGFRVKVGDGSYVTLSAGTGLKEFYCIAGATTTKVISIDASGTTSGTIDDVSVKELYGNHAYQTTATARAIYGRVPATGKNNILPNSIWAGGGFYPTGWSINYGTGTSVPYGTINGNTQYRQTATASERPNFNISLGTLGTTGSITASLFIDEVLSGSPTMIGMLLMTGPAGSAVAYFKNGVAANSTDLVSAGDRISAVLTSGGTSGAAIARMGVGAGAVIAADVVFSRPMANVGSTELTYQNSVSDYDTTEDGVPTLYGLKYDKLDDGYIFPSMTFTQPVTTIRGQRHVPAANASWLFFFDSANAGATWWEAAGNGVNTNLNGVSVGTPATYVNGTLVNPATRDALYDATLDANTIVTTKNLTLGTVALKAGLYASPYQFGGWEFGFVICEGMTDQEIAATEDYFNQHTGAY